MTKKQYIIEIFKKLKPYRPVLEEYLVLIQSLSCTDQDIEDIFVILERHVQDIQNEELRSEIQKTFDLIKKIHAIEQLSIQQDLKDIDTLLD
jgi:hypothetical protein